MRLWEVNADGSSLHPFVPDQGDSNPVCCGTWTRNGRSFVYLSMRSTSSEICVLPERTGVWHLWPHSVFRIRSEPLDRWTGPTPGTDGKHIFTIGEQLHGRLVRIDPQSRRAEPYLGGISAEGVSFSPDGSSIAFTSFPEGTLWRSNKDGTGRVKLTSPPLIARFPHWSPDGKTIVFVAGQAGSDWRPYTVPASGGALERLTQSGVNEGVANWSPDGKILSFGHLIEYSRNVKPRLTIEMLNLASGKSSIVPNSDGLWTARWSPDGRFLSALTEDNQTLRLYDLQTGSWTDLAKIGINDVAWSPDSKYLFFDTIYGAEPVLYRLRIADKKLEPWAQLQDSHRTGFFDSWLGMAPDGSPIFLEDASIQEIYSIAVDGP
jgi:Tol biopolymer transport system component